MRRKFAWLIMLVAFTLVVAACGDDDGGETTTTAAAGGGETTTTASGGGETTTTAAGGGETTTTAAASGGEVLTDIGVDAENKVISIGLLSDLTGGFAPLVIDITDAQSVYFENLNAAGGIDGWTVDLKIEDTNYNVEQHLEKYEKLREEVVAISQSTGSPTSVANLDAFKEDNMLFIPLSWYSGWGIPEFDGGLAFEQNTNYCIEAMNLMDFINENGGTSVALVTFPGDYGQDAAAGVKLAADFYGINIAYDGEAVVIPGQDQTPVITEIINSGADWVFATTNASTFAEILGGAVQGGYTGMWTGSFPTYDFRLLDTPVGPILDQVFYQSAYIYPWGTDAPGVVAIEEAMTAAYPDRRPSDAFIIGWNEAIAIHEALKVAIANGDLTRAGVAAAANSLTSVDYNGTSPNQSYAGTPNEYVQRMTAILKPSLEAYTAAGGAEQTMSDENTTTGSLLEKDFFVGEAAAGFEYTAPCYEL